MPPRVAPQRRADAGRGRYGLRRSRCGRWNFRGSGCGRNRSGLDQVVLRRSPPALDLGFGDVVSGSSPHPRCDAVDVDGGVPGADKYGVGRVTEFVRVARDARPGRAGIRALEAERFVALEVPVDALINQGARFELEGGIVVAAKPLRDGVSVVEVRRQFLGVGAAPSALSSPVRPDDDDKAGRRQFTGPREGCTDTPKRRGRPR